MRDELIDLISAAEELGVSRMTVYRLMGRYGMKRYKLPGKRRAMIRRSDLERLKQPQEVDGEPKEAEGKVAA